jgi:hypothetical protein
MALPVVPIISAVTPLVLGAFDLYRRRSEARTPQLAPGEPPHSARSAAALQQRMQELEASDLEQARLLSDLSKNLEALARAIESQTQDQRRREARLKTWLLATGCAAAVALILAVWAMAR